ncbi:MAG: MarC family protein, partial [Dehalococcoidia bacterium]|nr:MarC family protein [Dehalococcoidia bacterium]
LSLLRDFGLTFVPLFVAMDSISTVPILLSLTHELSDKKRNSVIRNALITALGLGLVFIVVGKGIFIFLGITVNDFLIAGGLILFLLGAKELVVGKMFEAQVATGEDVIAVVPLATPLVVGPAVLTTLLILTDQYHIVMVTFSFIVNLLISWLLFAQANRLVRVLGHGGVLALSKVFALLLAAIAVSMIHRGIIAFTG